MNAPRNSSSRPPAQAQPGTKKAYQAPRIKEYGSVPILTRSIAKHTVKDGGSNSIKT